MITEKIVKKELTPTWIKNKAGVVSCVPQYLAEDFLSKRIGWSLTEAEDVPVEKAYPMDGDFTKQGLERRIAINTKEQEMKKAEVVEEEEEAEGLEELTFQELKKLAKENGINSFGVTKEKLLEKLGELNN